MREHSHKYGRLHEAKIAQWEAFMRAAIRAHAQACTRVRHDLVAQRIRIKQFHKIRAGQEAALNHRLKQLEKEFFPK